jgi:hypothetical protein
MNGIFWCGIVIGALVSVLTDELLDLSAWVSPKMVRLAARRLPADKRDRYEEEWLAELASLEGLKLIKLIKALSIFRGTFALGRALDVNAVFLTRYILRLAKVRTLMTAVVRSRERQIFIKGLYLGISPNYAIRLIAFAAMHGPTAYVHSMSKAMLVTEHTYQEPYGRPRVTLHISTEATVKKPALVASKVVDWMCQCLAAVFWLRRGLSPRQVLSQIRDDRENFRIVLVAENCAGCAALHENREPAHILLWR